MHEGNGKWNGPVYVFDVGICMLIAILGSGTMVDDGDRRNNVPRHHVNASDVEGASKYRMALLSTIRSAVNGLSGS
jgi:hypothetical protein